MKTITVRMRRKNDVFVHKAEVIHTSAREGLFWVMSADNEKAPIMPVAAFPLSVIRSIIYSEE